MIKRHNSYMGLNYLEIKEIVKDIDSKIKGNHIPTIVLVNSTDIIFTFSFYRKEKLLISLNHNNPFLALIDSSFATSSLLNKLTEELRKTIKDTIVLNVEALNNDRIVSFTLQKTDEFFNKNIIYLVIELIPHHPNLLLLDENKRIIYATHYTSITDKRMIIKGMNYEAPINNSSNKEIKINLDNYNEEVNNYLNEAIKNRFKVKYQKLIDTLKRKIKTAKHKVDVLNKEINEAKEKMIYQEYGTMLLTLKDDKEELDNYIKENNVPYDNTKSLMDNVNLLFKKYKKAKETIAKDNEQLDNNAIDICRLEEDLLSLDTEDESVYMFLANQYLRTPIHKQDVNKLSPYCVVIDNTKIAFGRNASQNDLLTFKRSKKEYYFFHIENIAGSHVVILKNNPNDNDKNNAAMLAVALSNKEAANVQMSQVKDIKKGHVPGQVLFNNYSSIKINKVEKKVIDAIKKQIRLPIL